MGERGDGLVPGGDGGYVQGGGTEKERAVMLKREEASEEEVRKLEGGLLLQNAGTLTVHMWRRSRWNVR